VDFLNFITTEAARYPNFTLQMNAEVEDIIRAGGRIAGVRYRDADGHPHEIRAQLTIAADGRHSAVRRAAGLRPHELGSSIDVLMFPLSREDDDPDDAFTRRQQSPGEPASVLGR
jgi:2-polyprenyl-6-methoxyphenol hydroxylase-like FAD-dependent oxidoreductase